jgi:two-component system KDP operon response regulator KdpE
LKLTSTEFSLLSLLAKIKARSHHQYILKEIWDTVMLNKRIFKGFRCQLRKKIEDNPSKPTLLVTESGIGYRFGE